MIIKGKAARPLIKCGEFRVALVISNCTMGDSQRSFARRAKAVSELGKSKVKLVEGYFQMENECQWWRIT